MRVPNHLSSGEVSFNMTPMIDVVFLLIIFFLVSSHLAKQEAQLELPLPVAKSGLEPTETNAPRVTINILASGEVRLAGRTVAPDQLQSRLQARRDQVGADLEVRIRADRATAYRSVEPVMLAAARAGVWNVVFSVYREEDVR